MTRSLLPGILFATVIGFVMRLTAADAPVAPSGIANLKDLAKPVKLVAADVMIDGSMSVCGKLRDSQGQEFWFLLRQGPYAFGESASRDGLYVGYMSGHIPESARAKFDGWTERDFWVLLEQVIRDAFQWDPESGRLVAKNPGEFDSPSQAESFGRSAAKRLLRRAESFLGRKPSYMEPRKTSPDKPLASGR